jgi:hypothetical protein
LQLKRDQRFLFFFFNHLNILLDFSLFCSTKLWRTYCHLSTWIFITFWLGDFRFYFILRLD